MKAKITIAAAVSVILAVSCSREDALQSERQSSPIEVSIIGETDGFEPDTKSTMESWLRIKWSDSDVVWAYDKNGASLGKLTVTVEDDNPYQAVLKGVLDSAPQDGKLVLVHSSLLSTDVQPAYSGSLAVDMSNQNSDVVPFVAYSSVDGVTGTAYESASLKARFQNATSLLYLIVSGLKENAQIDSAQVSGVQNICVLTVSDGTVTVGASAPEVPAAEDKITVHFTAGTKSSSKGKMAFNMAVPEISSSSEKVFSIMASDYSTSRGRYTKDFSPLTEVEKRTRITIQADVTSSIAYIDEYGVNRGDGVYIASTDAVWAPVNCGYEPKEFPYGKLYQWGRKYGCGYEVTNGLTNDPGGRKQSAYAGPIAASEESEYYFYTLTKSGDWLSPSDSTRWGEEKTDYDPCPDGWRVPTESELFRLAGSGKVSFKDKSLSEYNGQNGVWMDGETSTASDTSSVNKIFLPFAGTRSYNGKFSNRTTYLYYWSSTGTESGAKYINAASKDGTVTNLGINGTVRSWGMSVRCVQE